jgi:septal ring factor EnvC (AmiA/AmiB activator)
MGEISDAGVHARGLTLATEDRARIVAPRGGRVVYAGNFRSYGGIAIIDHGSGWTTLVTDLASLDVKAGQRVTQGTPLGRAGTDEPQITVELRRNGRPFPIAPLLGLAG